MDTIDDLIRYVEASRRVPFSATLPVFTGHLLIGIVIGLGITFGVAIGTALAG
jgi:hypothetical protein